jgi:hypothetical protein
MSAEKNPVFVESGRRAARKRWGEQRILRLDELRPEARRLVMALVEADAENKKAAPTGEKVETAKEAHRVHNGELPAAS